MEVVVVIAVTVIIVAGMVVTDSGGHFLLPEALPEVGELAALGGDFVAEDVLVLGQGLGAQHGGLEVRSGSGGGLGPRGEGCC